MRISLQKVITSNLHKEFKQNFLKLIFFISVNHIFYFLQNKSFYCNSSWKMITDKCIYSTTVFSSMAWENFKNQNFTVNSVGRHLDQFVTLDVDYFQTAWLEAFLIALVFVFRVVWEGRLVFTYSTYWKLNISRNIRN